MPRILANAYTYDVDSIDVDDLVASLNSRVKISSSVLHDIAHADLRSLLGAAYNSKAESHGVSLQYDFLQIELILQQIRCNKMLA